MRQYRVHVLKSHCTGIRWLCDVEGCNERFERLDEVGDKTAKSFSDVWSADPAPQGQRPWLCSTRMCCCACLQLTICSQLCCASSLPRKQSPSHFNSRKLRTKRHADTFIKGQETTEPRCLCKLHNLNRLKDDRKSHSIQRRPRRTMDYGYLRMLHNLARFNNAHRSNRTRQELLGRGSVTKTVARGKTNRSITSPMYAVLEHFCPVLMWCKIQYIRHHKRCGNDASAVKIECPFCHKLFARSDAVSPLSSIS